MFPIFTVIKNLAKIFYYLKNLNLKNSFCQKILLFFLFSTTSINIFILFSPCFVLFFNLTTLDCFSIQVSPLLANYLVCRKLHWLESRRNRRL